MVVYNNYTPYSCQILMKLKFSHQIFVKDSHIKFRGNQSSGNSVVPFGETDWHNEANSRFSLWRTRLKELSKHLLRRALKANYKFPSYRPRIGNPLRDRMLARSSPWKHQISLQLSSLDSECYPHGERKIGYKATSWEGMARLERKQIFDLACSVWWWCLYFLCQIRGRAAERGHRWSPYYCKSDKIRISDQFGRYIGISLIKS